MDSIAITDMRGNFIDVNPSFCNLIGYSRDELLSMSTADIDARALPDEMDVYLKQIATSGKARFRTPLKCKDGSIAEAEISATVAEIDNERLFLCLAHDITNRM